MRKIMIRLALLAEQSGDKVSETRLEYTAEKLVQYGEEKVCIALEKLLETSRRFPTIAEVKAALGVAEPSGRDLGTRVANLMIQAMGKYGSLNSVKQTEAIKLAIGHVAWDIANKMGGWNMCCDRAADNMTAFIAQTRDLVESYNASGLIEAGDIPAALPSLGEALQIAGEKLKEIGARSEIKQVSGEVSFSSLANKIIDGGFE
jgi:hypothetical protein